MSFRLLFLWRMFYFVTVVSRDKTGEGIGEGRDTMTLDYLQRSVSGARTLKSALCRVRHPRYGAIIAFFAIFVTFPNTVSAQSSPSRVCFNAVQGKIAWDGGDQRQWNPSNVDWLCAGAENSTEPAKCFEEVMSGRVNWGGGTKWQWNNAINLCKGVEKRAHQY